MRVARPSTHFMKSNPMSQAEVFVVAAMRTAIGSFGGTLKDTPLSKPAITHRIGDVKILPMPALEQVLSWGAKLASGQADLFAQLDVKLHSAKLVLV